MPTDIDSRKEELTTFMAYGLGIVGLAILYPVVVLAVKAAIGLAALGVGAGVAFGVYKMAPYLGMKFANWRMKAIIAEAEANPIETMLNLQIEKTGEADEADRQINEFEAEIGVYDGKMESFTEQYPEEAEAFRQISQKMHEGLTVMLEEQSNARTVLADLDVRIDKAKAIYSMSLAAQRVTQFSKSAEAKVFQDIKEKVAFDAVRTQLHRSFAQLNAAVRQRQSLSQSQAKSLPPAQPRQTIAIPAVAAKAEVKVR